MPRNLYWDSCVFLSWINAVPERVPMLETIFDEARRKDVVIYTSTVSMTEVAYAATEKDARKLDDAVERAIDELFGDRDVIRVVEYHELIAREARRKIRQAITNGWSLKPMDAIHLATATRVSADELQTYDEPLLKYKGAMGFTIRQPVSLSPRLDLGDRGSLQQQP